MTFDGNPKPVQFIQRNVLDPACLSVGKHDGFADQFGLRRTVLIQNFLARRFIDGIACPCSAEPSVLSKAAQQRRLPQGSAAGMIDDDCSSNSRSRSICVLKLPGSSGSSFRNACSLSPISLTIARLCLGSMSMRLRIRTPRSGKRAPALQHPSRSSPTCEHRWQFGTEPETAAFGYLRVRLFLRTAGPVGTFGYPRHAPCSERRATVSCF